MAQTWQLNDLFEVGLPKRRFGFVPFDVAFAAPMFNRFEPALKRGAVFGYDQDAHDKD